MRTPRLARIPGRATRAPQGVKSGGLVRLAWLPIPLLTAAIIAEGAAGLHESHENEALRLVLSFAFYTLASLGTLFLIGRKFSVVRFAGAAAAGVRSGVVEPAGTTGCSVVDHGDANINVTIFNSGILLAGLCHLAGAILSPRPHRAMRARPLWLGVGCALGRPGRARVDHPIGFAGPLAGVLHPGQGGTTGRYCVLVSAIAAFVLAAVLLLADHRAARLPFTSWYSLALRLLAVGLFTTIQLSLWSVVNWLARTAQWLGGLYLLLAAIAALRESHQPLLPLQEKTAANRCRYAVAIAMDRPPPLCAWRF